MRRFICPAPAAAFVVPVLLGTPAFARANAADFIKKWDVEHDGTLDLAEIDRAADAVFAELDTDHDGTLDLKELGNRMTKAEFQAADKDHDGTLDKAEYESIVAQRFHAANTDGDSTIEAKELTKAAGKRLLRLLQ